MVITVKRNEFGCGPSAVHGSIECKVCGLKVRERGDTIFNLGDAFANLDPVKTGVHQWMCGSCVGNAIRKGQLVLGHPESTDDDLGPAEEESAFEVSW